MKCDRVKKLATAMTEDDGSFEVELPTDSTPKSSPPLNCYAKLLGGPTQLYASKKNMVSKIITTHEPNTYTISTPLSFSKSLPFYHRSCEMQAHQEQVWFIQGHRSVSATRVGFSTISLLHSFHSHHRHSLIIYDSVVYIV